MARFFVSEELEKNIQKPFTFISYCHDDKEIYNRVQELAKYLKDEGINIVYDGGELPLGEELNRFMNLIFNKNCKIVLVICDNYYYQKVTAFEGGVGIEYTNIEKDYPGNISKYIQLNVGGHSLPIFKGKIYADLYGERVFEKLKETLLERMKIKDGIAVKNRKIPIIDIIYNIQELYDEGSYKAAYEKIKTYDNNKSLKGTKLQQASLYNLKLIILLQLRKTDEYMGTVNILIDIISALKNSNNEDFYKKLANFYQNCGLAMREINKMDRCAEYIKKHMIFQRDMIWMINMNLVPCMLLLCLMGKSI